MFAPIMETSTGLEENLFDSIRLLGDVPTLSTVKNAPRFSAVYFFFLTAGNL